MLTNEAVLFPVEVQMPDQWPSTSASRRLSLVELVAEIMRPSPGYHTSKGILNIGIKVTIILLLFIPGCAISDFQIKDSLLRKHQPRLDAFFGNPSFQHQRSAIITPQVLISQSQEHLDMGLKLKGEGQVNEAQEQLDMGSVAAADMAASNIRALPNTQ